MEWNQGYIERGRDGHETLQTNEFRSNSTEGFPSLYFHGLDQIEKSTTSEKSSLTYKILDNEDMMYFKGKTKNYFAGDNSYKNSDMKQ